MERDISDSLKRIELQLFRFFLDICQKHKLTYFLVGGTCLGAVRHKGYIPWDDDIDVAMPRQDYEKFLSVAMDELPEDVFLQTALTDEAYPCNYAKLRKTNTAFIETSVSHLKINHGVFIDIFPLDGYKNSKYFEVLNSIYKTRINTAYNLNLPKNIIGKLIDILFPINYRKARDKQNKLMKKMRYGDSAFIANHCGAWGKKEIVPLHYFGNGTDGEFEGLKVRIPEKYHEYLTQLYGDYMKLPPVEERVAHHYCETIDFEKSYTEYVK